jgi:hypothetical protein
VYQRATDLRVQQQVFRAPFYRVNALARQLRADLRRNGPTQIGATQRHSGDASADQMRGDTTAGGFDFR